jgi:hypothetical protein
MVAVNRCGRAWRQPRDGAFSSRLCAWNGSWGRGRDRGRRRQRVRRLRRDLRRDDRASHERGLALQREPPDDHVAWRRRPCRRWRHGWRGNWGDRSRRRDHRGGARRRGDGHRAGRPGVCGSRDGGRGRGRVGSQHHCFRADLRQRHGSGGRVTRRDEGGEAQNLRALRKRRRRRWPWRRGDLAHTVGRWRSGPRRVREPPARSVAARGGRRERELG